MSDIRSLSIETYRQAAVAWLEGLVWAVVHGPDITPDAGAFVEAVA